MARSILFLLAGALTWTVFIATHTVRAADGPRAAVAAKPALTVNVVFPQQVAVPLRMAANGDIAAWQEASIGTEANGLRLSEVRAQVGDVVRRGQVLARFGSETLDAELAQASAAVAEAEATLAEAGANAERARRLAQSGALSAQQINQYLTAERTAQARLQAQRAALRTQQLRQGHTRVLAPDDGVISARSATVGAVLPAGQELFRLIRGGRLEWRAQVAAADLARLRPGMAAVVTPVGGAPVTGRIRVLAPTVDPATRLGLVYVDLPPGGTARAGMFARGAFELGEVQGLSLPQSAVLLREGFSHVLSVGPDARVQQRRVEVGQRWADRVQITAGVDAAERVVASGGGFLVDGDLVRVVDAPAGAAPAGPAR